MKPCLVCCLLSLLFSLQASADGKNSVAEQRVGWLREGRGVAYLSNSRVDRRLQAARGADHQMVKSCERRGRIGLRMD